MLDPSFEQSVGAGSDLVRELAQGLPTVLELLREHEDDFDEVLPTVFLSEIAQWYAETWLARETDPGTFDEASRFATRVAVRYPEVSPSERNMFAVGFLEALPNPGEAGRGCLEALPDILRVEREAMDSPNNGPGIGDGGTGL
ncbi:hypothetical protein [Saccharopolyspora spinosa]|uniref:Uncharacterized protein n=1 Tax=Saccharopolyspora spinosa TaxID=60894 RepID=A0A2N3Y1U5_SACSN|nr:hypothetical protein [Saccharopolyspora spinosa]PKW16872.1 hypothetical protein A8926_4770 [Saccharopolyspora spinosa]